MPVCWLSHAPEVLCFPRPRACGVGGSVASVQGPAEAVGAVVPPLTQDSHLLWLRSSPSGSVVGCCESIHSGGCPHPLELFLFPQPTYSNCPWPWRGCPALPSILGTVVRVEKCHSSQEEGGGWQACTRRRLAHSSAGFQSPFPAGQPGAPGTSCLLHDPDSGLTSGPPQSLELP